MVVFEYFEYRKILKDWARKARIERRGTVASLAEAVRVHPTFLSQVMSGKRDLSAEQALAAAQHMGFAAMEREYFFLLVQKERAGTKDLSAFYEEKLTKMRAERLNLEKRLEAHRTLTDEERAVFYSSWIYSAIRLFCSIGGSQTLDAIASRFSLSREKTTEILEFLCKTGLVKPAGGGYILGEQHTHVPRSSPFVVRHHLNWRLRAIHGLENASEEEMHFTAPMAISKKDFHRIREKIVTLIQEAVEVAKESPAEELACLGIDYFWGTRNGS